MNSNKWDKLTVYILAILVIALVTGELSTMLAIASHGCQGADCIELIVPK